MRVAVVGQSMEPALKDGDHLLVSRLAYRLARPRRGEIVFLRPPAGGADSPECIKRLVGLPNERVRIESGVVAIDDHPLSEPYRQTRPAPAEMPAPSTNPGHEWTLGPDEYVVLGDNRALSTDSRAFGPVRRGEVAGRAWYRYAPPERRGRLGRPGSSAGRP
jgi:signal peptidase I